MLLNCVQFDVYVKEAMRRDGIVLVAGTLRPVLEAVTPVFEDPRLVEPIYDKDHIWHLRR